MTARAELGAEEGRGVLAEAVDAYSRALGERLLAAYALGSLAHGGFSLLVSDVDLGLVLADPVGASDAEAVGTVAGLLKTGGSELHRRLSVFWGTPSTLRGELNEGRFPPLDRLDLVEHGRLLFGVDVRDGLPRASRDELLISGAEFALDFLSGIARPGATPGDALGSMRLSETEAIEEIRRPDVLLSRGVRRLTKLILFPVRFLFTATTGQVGTNELAVEHHLATPGAPAARLVAAGLGWRTTPPVDRAEAATLLDADMIPLYLHYIEDHAARLVVLGRADLAAVFTEWRRRLLE